MRFLKTRLSFLFYMQYFINGAIFPIIALYLRDYLRFTGVQTGAVLATASVSAVVSPLAGAVIADKYLSAEGLYALCHCMAALMILSLAFAETWVTVLVLYFLFGLFFGPTMALANAIVFHHTPGLREQFGGLRLWGTVGWMSVAMGFSIFWLRRGGSLRGALILAGLAGFLLALFSCTALPRGEKRAAGRVTVLPLDALKVFTRPDILVLSVVTLMFVTGEKIYYFGTGIYLRSLGLPEAGVMPFMSIAQAVEIAAMILLAPLLRRFREKKVLALGLGFLVLKFMFLALGGSLLLSGLGVACHGPSFTLFMITTFIYLDKHCEKEYRTGVHQVFNFIEAGLANLLGNVGAGFLMDRFTMPGGGVNFSAYWMAPGIIAALLLFLILVFFPRTQAN